MDYKRKREHDLGRGGGAGLAIVNGTKKGK